MGAERPLNTSIYILYHVYITHTCRVEGLIPDFPLISTLERLTLNLNLKPLIAILSVKLNM